jgi:hypothetical protein
LKTKRRERGQSLVEFTLVLPLILILLAVSIDMGRLFMGWVGLNNAVRIAANYAAAVPTGPFTAGSEYELTVRRDTTTSNCPPTTVAAPVFNPNTSVGSQATVELTCTFRLLTPILGSIVGNQFQMSARAVFIVRSGDIAGVPVPPPPPCTAPNLAVPNLVGLEVQDARTAWTAAGFTGSFSPSSGVPNKTVTGQIPDVGACRAPTQSVFVTHT